MFGRAPLPERFRSLLQGQQKKLRQQMLILAFAAGIGGGNNRRERMSGGAARRRCPAFNVLVRVRQRRMGRRNSRRQQAVKVPGRRHGRIQQIVNMRRAPPAVKRRRREGRREVIAHGCQAMSERRWTGARSPARGEEIRFVQRSRGKRLFRGTMSGGYFAMDPVRVSGRGIAFRAKKRRREPVVHVTRKGAVPAGVKILQGKGQRFDHVLTRQHDAIRQGQIKITSFGGEEKILQHHAGAVIKSQQDVLAVIGNRCLAQIKLKEVDMPLLHGDVRGLARGWPGQRDLAHGIIPRHNGILPKKRGDGRNIRRVRFHTYHKAGLMPSATRRRVAGQFANTA